MSKKIRQKLEKIGIIKCILIMTLMLVFLCGCGSKVEDMSAKEENIQVVEEIQNGNIEEENTEETGRGTEDMETEEVTEVQQEENAASDMKKAEVVTTVNDFLEILDYAETFNEPALLIYNEKEGYVINMGEGNIIS